MKYLPLHCVIAALFSMLFSVTSLAENDADKIILKAMKSEKRIIIYAQKFIDAGQYKEANILLERAIIKYPDKDLILALRGEALYQSKQIDLAEKYFRQALYINPQNEVANKYIEKIRQIMGNREDKTITEWKSIARDKVGDFFILVIGIWLGTTINSIGHIFQQWRYQNKSRKFFLKGDYETFTDILENQIIEYNPVELRKSLRFMLLHKSPEETKTILQNYVLSKAHLESLLRLLDRLYLKDNAMG